MDSVDSAVNLPLLFDFLKRNTTTPLNNYQIPMGGFQSFNEFFSRNLKNKTVRPISDPADESIVVAPADSEVNFILSDLTLDTPLKMKT